MNLDELTLDARILQELGEINAGQKHLHSEISEINADIREIKERVRVLETVQAECQVKRDVKSSAITKGTALVSGIISAVVSGVFAIFTVGSH